MSRLGALCIAAFVLALVGHALSQPSSLSSPPEPCDAVPAPDTLNGSPGSAPCYTPRDAARPTAVQGATVKTDATGAWAVSWGRSFQSAEPVLIPVPINTGTLPMVCNVTSRSATAAAGRCWQASTTTLASTITGLLGKMVNPFADPAANASVMVIAREPTQ